MSSRLRTTTHLSVLAACLLSAGPSGLPATGSQPVKQCARRLTVGHVPGHLNPVWQLTCSSPAQAD